MQTSRFQLGLIATLALGLGFSLASSDAIGYPAGPAVSLGTNPVWSKGGGLADTVTVTATDGDLIITDCVFSSTQNGWWRADLDLDDGATLAAFRSENLQDRNGFVQHFESGLRVPQGSTLTINWDGQYGASSYYRYTLSGYYAQP